MNLVHAGGENETSNPRVFATFSEEYMAFENQNYINNCSICCDDCQTCDIRKRMMYEEVRNTLLKGLEHDIHRYTSFSLKEFGFFYSRQIQKSQPLWMNSSVIYSSGIMFQG